jgi:ribosomal protein S18 acetylase RimI-like enzyme
VRARQVIAVEDHRVDVRAALTAEGFAVTRWFSVMRRPLTVPLPVVAVPEGVCLVPFDPGLDERIRVAHNEAFAEHWGFQPWTPGMWQEWATGHRNFRPDWSFAVLAGAEVVGYALSAAYEQDWATQGWTEGWTSRIGVLQGWRGHGVATALLAASLHAFAAGGMQFAGLEVDSKNPSGAVALYTGLGYEIRRRSCCWTKDL